MIKKARKDCVPLYDIKDERKDDDCRIKPFQAIRMDDCDRFFYGFIHFRFGNFNRFRSWVAGEKTDCAGGTGGSRSAGRYRAQAFYGALNSAGKEIIRPPTAIPTTPSNWEGSSPSVRLPPARAWKKWARWAGSALHRAAPSCRGCAPSPPPPGRSEHPRSMSPFGWILPLVRSPGRQFYVQGCVNLQLG